MSNLLKRLQERGGIGLDLSPGDPLCVEAANWIEQAMKILPHVSCPHCIGNPMVHGHADWCRSAQVLVKEIKESKHE
jgi:hypothetical protein